VKHCNFKYR